MPPVVMVSPCTCKGARLCARLRWHAGRDVPDVFRSGFALDQSAPPRVPTAYFLCHSQRAGDDVAAQDGGGGAELLQLGDWQIERVAVADDQVGQLSRLDGALATFLEIDVGGGRRVGVECFERRDRLLRCEPVAEVRLARDGTPDPEPRIERFRLRPEAIR